MRKSLLLIVSLILILTSCTLPAISSPDPVQYIEVTEVLVTANPDGTATPTPFQPLPITATPTLAATPTPTLTPAPPTPTPWTYSGEIPEGQRKIMLLGSDSRGDGGFRTDVIVLLVLNPQQGTASLVSFPRDLYVTIPGVGENRINTAMVYGGFNLLAATMETNFGFRPDSYILTNFNGFTDIVDSMGGISVEAAYTLTDKCDLPQQNAVGYCTVGPGTTGMDGATALWYVRSRYTSSDFDRTRREQEVLKAIFDKLLSLDAVSRAPDIYEQYRKNVEISLSLEDVLSLVSVAPQLTESGHIRRYTIGPGLVYDYTVPDSGARVLLPNQSAIISLIYQALAP